MYELSKPEEMRNDPFENFEPDNYERVIENLVGNKDLNLHVYPLLIYYLWNVWFQPKEIIFEMSEILNNKNQLKFKL